jgi:hypothetical protein
MRAGDLATAFRGVRVEKSSSPTFLARCEAYGRLIDDRHCLSHVTAALLWGCPLPAGMLDGPLHVSGLAGTVRPRMRGVVGHELSGSHVRLVRRHGLPVTDPVTTWLQLSGLLGPRWLVAVGDHFVLDPIVADADDPRPYCDPAEFAQRASAFTGRNCRRARQALERVRPGVESPRETFLRLELVEAGLPEPVTAHPIFDSSGRRIAIADLAYPEQKVLVEYDGDHHRTDSRQFRRDIERHDDLLAERWTHIRVGKDSPPRAAVERTRMALRAASAHRPGTCGRYEPSIPTTGDGST